MKIIKFNRYGVCGSDVTVIAERITHWYPVAYNGNQGTVIVLDTGKEVTVGHWSTDVEKMVAGATE